MYKESAEIVKETSIKLQQDLTTNLFPFSIKKETEQLIRELSSSYEKLVLYDKYVRHQIGLESFFKQLNEINVQYGSR